VADSGEAAARGAQIVCLQELFPVAVFFAGRKGAELFALAESIPGPTTETLGAAGRASLGSSSLHRFLSGGRLGFITNTAAVIGVGRRNSPASIARMHIPDDPLYFEKFYFTPGDLGFVNFNTSFARGRACLVCWDQWYPEAARLSSLSGAKHSTFYPTAIGWHPSEKAQFGAGQLDAWRTIQRSHAIANGIYVAAVNRVGVRRAARSRAGVFGARRL